MSDKKALFEEVANAIIEKLEKGTSPWQKPWSDRQGTAYNLPYNPTTDNNYKGMNSVWLMLQDREDPRWLTFKQAQANGWQVNKGEKAKTINFIKLQDVKTMRDDKGKPVLDENGKPRKIIVNLRNPIITTAWVFNAEQISGIPPLSQSLDDSKREQKWSNVERAEFIAEASKAKIIHGGNQAYYSPGTDHVQMPNKDQFNNASAYYGTLLHELGHWTGDKNRLDRDMSGRFGSVQYAKEELIAEIASYMVRGQLGLEKGLDQTAAYAKSWIQVLKNDPYEIFRASASAQKINDYLLDFELKRDLKKEAKTKVDKPVKSADFIKGESIPYKDETYQIIEVLPRKVLQVKIEESSSLLKVTAKDGLYQSLLKAKSDSLDLKNVEAVSPRQPVLLENNLQLTQNFKR
jgi:putative DNA primase/helicase